MTNHVTLIKETFGKPNIRRLEHVQLTCLRRWSALDIEFQVLFSHVSVSASLQLLDTGLLKNV